MTPVRIARKLEFEDAREEVAPQMADFTTDVLVGNVWERPGLSKRERSLITVATLTGNYSTELRDQMHKAMDNGVTKVEIGEIITHIAFYTGWPTAANAIRIAKQVFEER